MNARRKTVAAVFLFTAAVCTVFGLWNHKNTIKKETAGQETPQAGEVWKHLDRKDIRENCYIDESFASALPLVILDTRPGKNQAEVSNRHIGTEPYTRIKLSFIDHENEINLLGDRPAGLVYARIQESAQDLLSSQKKQYLLRLQIEDGQPFSLKILGMAKSEVWLLKGFQADESCLRDYITLNTAHVLSPDSRDMRFCEVVFRYDHGYEYMGLYGIYNIAEEKQDEKGRILNDIKTIEECLHSEQDSKFFEYRDLLDVDSFVDYFIINEFFLNYDGGWDSSCFYKDPKGKIHIRVTGGADSAMADETLKPIEIHGMGLSSALWFDRLVTDEYFVEKTVKRYGELRKTVLNQDLLDKKLESAAARLGEAASRDRKRWPGLNQEQAVEGKQGRETGFTVDRSRNAWEEDAQRAMDTIRLHGNYLDEHITDLYKLVQPRNNWQPKIFLSICFIASFFISVLVVQKVRNGSS